MGQADKLFRALGILILGIAVFGISDAYAFKMSDVLLPTPKKIEKRVKQDFQKVERQIKSDAAKVDCLMDGDVKGAARLFNNDLRNAKQDIKGEVKELKQDANNYRERIKERMLRDYQKVKKISDKIVNKAAELNNEVHKPVAQTMDNVMSTQPKAVQKLYEKYPGTTTLVATGDTTAASVVQNAKKCEDPDSKSAGVDGILSTTYITHPAEYYNTQFLSGASGEKTDTDGMNNYVERIYVGSSTGAARGGQVGASYGGSWGAVGGAVGGAVNGAYVGSMTPEQSDNTVDQLLLGKSEEVEKINKPITAISGIEGGIVTGIDKTSKVLGGDGIGKALTVPNGVADVRNTNRAAWESGHEGNYFGDGSKEFGKTMFGPTALLDIGGTGDKGAEIVKDGYQQGYEDTGVNFQRAIPRVGEEPYK